MLYYDWTEERRSWDFFSQITNKKKWNYSGLDTKVTNKCHLCLILQMNIWQRLQHWMVLAALTRMEEAARTIVHCLWTWGPLPSFCLSSCSDPLLDPMITPASDATTTCKNMSFNPNNFTYSFLSFQHDNDNGPKKNRLSHLQLVPENYFCLQPIEREQE